MSGLTPEGARFWSEHQCSAWCRGDRHAHVVWRHSECTEAEMVRLLEAMGLVVHHCEPAPEAKAGNALVGVTERDEGVVAEDWRQDELGGEVYVPYLVIMGVGGGEPDGGHRDLALPAPAGPGVG